MIINLYTSIVLSYLKLLKLKSCKVNNICGISKNYCQKKLNKITKSNKKLQAKLCSRVPNIHIETDFSNFTQE